MSMVCHPNDPTSPRQIIPPPPQVPEQLRQDYVRPPSHPPPSAFLFTHKPPPPPGVPEEDEIQVPAEPFRFRTARVQDAAMSPFFHNFVNDIRTTALEKKAAPKRNADDPLWTHRSKDSKETCTEGEGKEPMRQISRSHSSVSSSSAVSSMPDTSMQDTQLGMVARFGCFFNDCGCELYDPHLFLPYSLASDDEWTELYEKLREFMKKLCWFPNTERENKGRYLRLGNEETKLSAKKVEKMKNYILEYRKIKVLLEVMKEKERRKEEPFNPKNWTAEEEVDAQIEQPILLCNCGHSVFWHSDPEAEKRNKLALEEEERKFKEARDIMASKLDGHLGQFAPVEKTPEETSQKDEQIILVGGKLVKPKKIAS